MKRSGCIIAGLALASLAFAAPVCAQDSGSMAVGNATVTVGGGTAILTLPDIEFTTVGDNTVAGISTFARNENQEIDGEIGWNINGSLEIPTNGWPGDIFAIKGFFARIEGDDTLRCAGNLGIVSCVVTALVDTPAAVNKLNFGLAGGTVTADRKVDHWGAALEAKRNMTPDVMGVTRGSSRRYVAVGLDYREIDQDVAINGRSTAFNWNYNEDLDTRYTGVYAAYAQEGGALPIIGNILTRLGLESSLRVQGGVYYADTDYDGRLFGGLPSQLDSTLSLSEDAVAFIGGLTLTTRKRIGRRAELSLQSVYEYYSWVPDMKYNDTDVRAVFTAASTTIGTSIGSDDAFSARTSLRLTIKLGPDSIFEEPLK